MSTKTSDKLVAKSTQNSGTDEEKNSAVENSKRNPGENQNNAIISPQKVEESIDVLKESNEFIEKGNSGT